MVLNQEPSAQLGTMNHSLNPRLSTQPGSNLIRLVLSHRLVFFNYDDFGGRWTVDGRRILVFPAFSNSFFASCEAASLSRTFLRASLPRASEPHFLAKPALRPRTLFRALRPGPFLPSPASDVLLQHHFLAKPALRPPVLFGALRPAEGGIASYFSSEGFFPAFS